MPALMNPSLPPESLSATPAEAALIEENARLRQENALLRTIIDSSPVGLVLYEAVRDRSDGPQPGAITDFRYRLVNPENCRVTGRSEADFKGRTVLDLFPGTSPEPFFQTLLAVTQTGETRRLEFPYEGDGIRGWFDGSFSRQGDGVLFTFVDITAAKEAQLTQQRTADLLRNVMNAAPAGISLMQAERDADGNLLDFRLVMTNDATARMTGRTVADIVGKSVTDTFPTYRPLGIYDRYRAVLETRQPDHFEVHYRGDGLENWFDITVHPEGDGVVGTFLDITPIRQAQQAERGQKELLQSLLDTSLTALSLFEAVRADDGSIADFRLTMVNQTGIALYGLTADQLLGQLATVLSPGLAHSEAFAQYVSVVETGQSVTLERMWQGRHFLVSVVRFRDGFLTSSIDITARKRAEMNANEQQELLRSVLDGSQNAIIAFEAVRNADGHVTDFRYILQNRANQQRTGRTDEQLLGRTMLEFFPEVGTSGLLTQYAKVVETGEPLRFELEFTYQHVPGWYDYSVVKRGDGIVLTVHDKTDERNARRLVEQANAELLKSNENLQNFAYVASHDLQEPLRKIKSFGDMVLTQYGGMLPEPAQDLLRRMQTAATRMSGLIHDLLDLSRLTTQKRLFRPVDLNQLMADVLGDLELTVSQTGAVVEVADLPTVPGDDVQLGQLFQNLLSNALKFRRPDTPPRVRVSGRRVTMAEVPAGLLAFVPGDEAKPGRSRPYYALSVTDNGIGFDAARYGERVFGAFQRLHGRTAPYTGTGIGLAVAKKVADNHGGGISVDSREGEGATFTVYLPL